VVARRTGLTPATIRAWERRYGAVEPARSDGGQRLYSDRDLERLSTLRRLTEMGRSIGSVAALLPEEAEALLTEDRAATAETVRPLTSEDPLETWADQAYASMRALDREGLERVLWRAFTTLGAPRFLDGVATALLRRVGSGWEAGEVSPAQEHLGSEVLDRVLAEVSDRLISAAGAPRIIVATLPGERHGLGGRLVAAAAALEGWRVTYLGTDLPASEIADAASALSAQAVAISVVTSELVGQATEALRDLRSLLSPGVKLFVGGRASGLLDPDRLPAGVALLEGLGALRALGPPGSTRATTA
jgi:DNA-binding transcriptional MerR regulator/methylmalonyl-CoA mutase cobalamin-binding subunit